jgi:hypothetical protein
MYIKSIGFLSDPFKKLVSDKLFADRNGNFSLVLNEKIEFIDPEFGIFNECTLGASGDNVTIMMNRCNLRISDFKHVIQLVDKMIDFYGEDDSGNVGINSDDIEEIVNWTDIEYVSIIRLWRNALKDDCKVAVHFSLDDNNISLVIANKIYEKF